MKSKKIPLSEVNITEEEEVQIVQKYHDKKDFEIRKRIAAGEIAVIIGNIPDMDLKEVINMAIDLVNFGTEEAIKINSELKERYAGYENQLKKKLIKKL